MPNSVRRRAWGAALALLLAQAVSAGSAAAQVPAVITREWVKHNFLEMHDIPADSTEQRTAAEWRAVRRRPELPPILIEIAEARNETFVVRANAIMGLGDTRDPRAFAYLFGLHRRLDEGDPYRVNVAVGIGQGRQAIPDEGYTILEELLATRDPRERRGAMDALGIAATGRARGMLQSAAARERDPFLQEVIRENLRRAEQPSPTP